MSWQSVARKDFTDAVRSNTFGALAAGFLLVTFVLSGLQHVFGDPTFQEGLRATFGTMGILLPIVAVVLSYQAIVGERSSGSLHVLLSLPVSRRELLVGKTAGRAAVLFVPLAVGFSLAIPLLYLLYGGFDGSQYAKLLVSNLANGVLYTVLGVAVSASVSTRRRALAVLTGLFLWVYFALYTIPDVLYWAVNGTVPETPTTWMRFVETIPPHEALAKVVDALWAGELSTAEPLLLQEWVSGIVLIGWVVLPVAVAIYRFERTDIV